MLVHDALNSIARKLGELNCHDLLCGLPRLHEQDRSWGEWGVELQNRASYLGKGRVSQDDLDAIGALVLAMKLRLAAEEEVDIASGDAA